MPRRVLHAPEGLPELDIPPDAIVTWEPGEGRYSVTAERAGDQVALLRGLFEGRLVDVTPSAGHRHPTPSLEGAGQSYAPLRLEK